MKNEQGHLATLISSINKTVNGYMGIMDTEGLELTSQIDIMSTALVNTIAIHMICIEKTFGDTDMDKIKLEIFKVIGDTVNTFKEHVDE